MKFPHLAAAILSASSGLSITAPFLCLVEPQDFRVSVLGGLTFKINQVPNRKFSPFLRGPRALAGAYAKFGMRVPDDLQLALQDILRELGIGAPNRGSSGTGNGSNRGGGGRLNNNQTTNADQGEVAAIPQMFDSEYLAEVQIGTPPQTLTLNFDTGSSDLWVFSTETPPGLVNGQALYSPSTSTTSRRLEGSTWSIRYGDGSASSGDVFLDVVTVGGVTVESQAVESATNLSAAFTADGERSGLLGLAFGSINQVRPSRQRTFFENAMAELAMPLFTANLNKGEAGNYNFGFVDPSEFRSGSLAFVDVNATSGFWQFAADGYRVGPAGGGGGGSVARPHLAIADTGTTLLLLPDDVVAAYYASVPSVRTDAQAGGVTFLCSENLPDFTASIGSYDAVVPGELVNFAPLGPGSDRCFGGIQSQGELPFAIYGDVFFKGQFVVFHGGNNQLGFAPKPV